MIVLDTHAWLWWLSEPERLGPAAREAIDGAERVGVSTISCWEVAALVARGRIALDRDPYQWIAQALAHPRSRTLTLTSDIAVKAGMLDQDDFPGDPADRIVYSTARAEDARLVTKDRRLRGFDPARTVW